MAKKNVVVFWQRIPYDVFAGGDGLYLDRLKAFFLDQNWEVYTLTSRLDRPRLLMRIKYTLGGNRIIIKDTYQVSSCYVVKPLTLVKQIFRYLLINKPVLGFCKNDHKIGQAEKKWLLLHLNKLSPNLVVKCFDRAGSEEFDVLFQGAKLHLIGFLKEDQFILRQGNSSGEKIKENILPELRSTVGNIDRKNISFGFSSKTDKLQIQRLLPGCEALYIGIGFTPTFIANTSTLANVLFVGNKTRPNYSAVKFLLEEIWPVILSTVPEARLRVVGRVCHYFVKVPLGVDLIGEIDDLRSEYAKSKVVVAPLVIGSAGVKTKIAEGLAYGRAVVCTSLGVDQAQPDQFDGAAFVADSPETFAHHVSNLLIDDSLRAQMEVQSERVFLQNFAPTSAYQEIEDWLKTHFKVGP
ncbi:glycosyltransferase family 4 protein [Methylobacterium pseudosasicola]|uniref:Glycosyltransferase involved in cell wall bisynthesis n=1 Tax=Methylobacterium pseudosasicola TaxID=582667 RepID=A0A1I4VHY2_9HYPH|nr:glycosyltransferase [Methylobacterium pseudosasicola]SFN00844.1 Glycosyltransferase involved in cell wall bisynthesis [Methylobacterium pseudosasicola]